MGSRVVAAIAAVAVWLTIGVGAAEAATVEKQGYVPMSDGTQLAYTLELPAGTGRFPVALIYDGYCEGSGPLTCNDVPNANALLARGYAVLGVNIRGTGCSTGTFEAFTPQEWRDGAAVVEWAAGQPWSTGRVGMFGDSFPGITQVGVASRRPRGLVAIAPFQVVTDLYRDAGYPGGIQNTGFGAFWAGADQPAASYSGAFNRVKAGDTACAATLATHGTQETQNLALQGLLHPFDDAYWQARRPGAGADKIDVPAFGCVSWQDDETSSRGSEYLRRLDPRRTWVVATNGYHSMCAVNAPRITAQLVAFFDRFVKGEDNGYERTPRIQIWHEAATDGAKDNVPSWVTSFSSLGSMPVKPLALWFGSTGELSLSRPRGGAPARRYAYPGPSLGNEDGLVAGQNDVLWKGGAPPGASVAYTTPALTRDAEFFGSGSANVWMSSTAPDTDLQITLTEIRPDGQEVYVVRGWLRASRRALDPSRSTRLVPYQTHQEADARPLEPGRPTLMRIHLLPFDHVFRTGSSLRLWIDAPTGVTGGWSLDFTKTPAVNSIYADPDHPSALVLGSLRGGRAEKPYPACDTLLNQPCRTNATPVPAGTMTIR
jgi:uncharacterized protein